MNIPSQFYPNCSRRSCDIVVTISVWTNECSGWTAQQNNVITDTVRWRMHKKLQHSARVNDRQIQWNIISGWCKPKSNATAMPFSVSSSQKPKENNNDLNNM